MTQVRDAPREQPFGEIVTSSLKSQTLDWIEEICILRPADLSYKTRTGLQSVRKEGLKFCG